MRLQGIIWRLLALWLAAILIVAASLYSLGIKNVKDLLSALESVTVIITFTTVIIAALISLYSFRLQLSDLATQRDIARKQVSVNEAHYKLSAVSTYLQLYTITQKSVDEVFGQLDSFIPDTYLQDDERWEKMELWSWIGEEIKKDSGFAISSLLMLIHKKYCKLVDFSVEVGISDLAEVTHLSSGKFARLMKQVRVAVFIPDQTPSELA